MTPPTAGSRWVTLSASQIGSVHVRDGTPNQDAHHTWSDSTCAVVAVADGHGDRPHFRSDVGSRLAAYVAVDILRDEVGGLVDPIAVGRRLRSAIGPQLVDRWTAAVLEHVAQHPFGPHEKALVGGTTDLDLLRPYGTTILAMAASPGVLAVLQLGDGEAVVVSRGGEVYRPLPVDPVLDGRHTTSLCQAEPMASLRCVGLDASDDIALGFICTDGFGAPQLDNAGWWRLVGSQLFEHQQGHGHDWMSARLPGWLEEPALLGGDDTTLAILSCVSALNVSRSSSLA